MYSAPRYLQEVYSQNHRWFDEQKDTAGYRKVKVSLNANNIVDVASQFHCFFAAHYFKTFVALKKIVTHEIIASWIQDNDSDYSTVDGESELKGESESW